GIGGRIIGADVVGLLDDAAPEQPIPRAVGDGTGEPRVGGGDQPVGEDGTRVAPGSQRCGSSVGKNGGLADEVRGIVVKENDLLLPLGCIFVADPGEK